MLDGFWQMDKNESLFRFEDHLVNYQFRYKTK